jgi:hypothetical protein
MKPTRVSLGPLDSCIHYSLAILFGLPILIFTGYFVFGQLGLIDISPYVDEMIVVIPGVILGPISLLIYLMQRQKLRFQFIQTSIDIQESKLLIKEIAREQKWAIHSFKDDTYTLKTDPGFINQSWGQHITVQLVKGGLLVNSIFDTNKGSLLITFGSNQKNLTRIKQAIENKANARMTGDNIKI